jgi:hypothetical protein
MISDFEKNIYNSFLKNSRASSNKPYTYRKDFSNLDEKIFICLKKLSSFFNRNKSVKLDDFFRAPYTIYPDNGYVDLSFYTTLKAAKAYTIFQKQREKLEPDDVDQLTSTKDSFKFIAEYCKQNSISIDNYISFKDENIFAFLVHLKERKINIYSLLTFDNFERNFKASDNEVIRFMLGDDFVSNLNTFKVKYFNSKKCRFFAETCKEKIKKSLNSSHNNIS